jgi:hypothetical protein
MVFKSMQTNDSYPTPSLIYELLDVEFHFDPFDTCPLDNPQHIAGLTMAWPHFATRPIANSKSLRDTGKDGYKDAMKRHYKGRLWSC